ncbi:MAG TPA: YceI family protein [Mucilaginibacter sp.]
MKKIFSVTILAFLAFYSFAQSKVVSSEVTFKIKNLGFNVGGSFSGLNADINFKPAALAASSIEASVASNTVNTDNESRDNHLKSEDYFDAAKYPRITVKSVSFKHKSGNNYTGVFNVTIKDKTKPVEIPFTYTETGNTATFKGDFQVLRTDFGVGGKNVILSNEANVSVAIGVSK